MENYSMLYLVYLRSEDPYLPGWDLVFYQSMFKQDGMSVRKKKSGFVQCTILMIMKKSFILFTIVLCTGKHAILKIKAEIHFLNMDDAQRLSWLFTYETSQLASYIERAWKMKLKKPVLYSIAVCFGTKCLALHRNKKQITNYSYWLTQHILFSFVA